MRYWIEYLLNNANAYADFIKYISDCEAELRSLMQQSLMKNEMEEARGLAHELNVYETMRKRATSEMKERQSQATYNQQFEGRQ